MAFNLLTSLLSLPGLSFGTYKMHSDVSIVHIRKLICGTIEIIQPSFGRSADINDYIADSVGVICGMAAGNLIRT